MDDKLELRAEEHGITATIERVPPPAGSSLKGSSYRVTLKLPPTTEIIALFSSDAMDALVRFIGDARDDPRSADLLALMEEKCRELVLERSNVEQLEGELAYVRGEVATLVEALHDAWWLDAASAYRNLAEWADPR